MIIPTMTIELWKKKGSDAFAQPKFVKQPPERICPVRLSFQTDNSTVRTDSAGSKGHAQEYNAQVVILATPRTAIAIDDKLVILGNSLRVVEKHPRYTASGALDHYQIHCLAWT